ncbi:LAFA_0F13014g1_1 [Lachancea sp. 'fantastica']|nr:LAFA_0F13014g1_1 [Lachancea sp. 'fantastica']
MSSSGGNSESWQLGNDIGEHEANGKKRRKTIKQCLFCRKRKLKCDKKKPMCSTCASRGLKECVYVEHFGPELTTQELLKNTPNLELINRVKELEEELKLYRAEFQLTQGFGPNPLPHREIIICKSSRKLYYGCTSIKVLMADSKLKFDTYYEIVWSKIKEERRRWKSLNGYSTLREVTTIEDNPQSRSSVVEAMCTALPFYEQLEQSLHEFFNGPIHKGFEMIDPMLAFNILEKCFIRGPRDPISGMHPVSHLIPTAKKNYYGIGLVTIILTMVNHNQPVPQALDHFDKFLLSCLTAKVYFIERVQYLFLKRIYMLMKGYVCGDHSGTATITRMLSMAAIQIGLHKNIKKLFPEHSASHGAVKYLENLWLWIVHADFETSVGIGTPSQIPECFMEYDLMERDDFGSFSYLRNIVRSQRSILRALHDKNRLPDIRAIMDLTKSLLEANFKPASFYAEKENLKTVSFAELNIYVELLSSLSLFANLQRIYFKIYDPIFINSTLQFSAQTVKLCGALVEAFFELDKAEARQGNVPMVKGIPLNLCLAVLVLHNFYPRCIADVYVLLASLPNVHAMRDLRSKYGVSATFDLPMDSLETVSDHYVPLLTAHEFLSSYFNRWDSPENAELTNCLRKYCYGFVIMRAIEGSGRDLFQHYSNIMRNGRASLTGIEQPEQETQMSFELPQPSAELSDEILNAMADEFWDNYDLDLNKWLNADILEFNSS